ncbi:Hypothetical predicted protein [Marmota monax]|uniref:Uncharacterized protein n=1 Tax=Marmota monax TaxID=9995 RepID=A0A5E4B514_MARMO|nr:hypothetical protein GHT09_011840 [Marmota monax]VTJ64813.1 Hypothetical predicted protein [Marmota monax]
MSSGAFFAPGWHPWSPGGWETVETVSPAGQGSGAGQHHRNQKCVPGATGQPRFCFCVSGSPGSGHPKSFYKHICVPRTPSACCSPMYDVDGATLWKPTWFVLHSQHQCSVDLDSGYVNLEKPYLFVSQCLEHSRQVGHFDTIVHSIKVE